MQPQNLIITVLLALLLATMLGCAEDTETPTETSQLLPETPTLTVPEIAEIALRSTVYLRYANAQGQSMFGSGFVVKEGGLIATVYHAAAEMKANSTAQLVTDVLIHPIEAIVSVDQAHDLAIVQCSRINAPPLPLGDSDTVRIGDMVYTVGNPREYAGTFSGGFISQIRPGGEFVMDKVF